MFFGLHSWSVALWISTSLDISSWWKYSYMLVPNSSWGKNPTMYVTLQRVIVVFNRIINTYNAGDRETRFLYLWSTDKNFPSIVCFEVKQGGLTRSDRIEADPKLLIILPTATRHDPLFADSESAPTPLSSLSSPWSKLFADKLSHSFVNVHGFK